VGRGGVLTLLVVLTQFEELVDMILPKSPLHNDGVALGMSIQPGWGLEFEVNVPLQ
jgi:hypothetical protein